MPNWTPANFAQVTPRDFREVMRRRVSYLLLAALIVVGRPILHNLIGLYIDFPIVAVAAVFLALTFWSGKKSGCALTFGLSFVFVGVSVWWPFAYQAIQDVATVGYAPQDTGLRLTSSPDTVPFEVPWSGTLKAPGFTLEREDFWGWNNTGYEVGSGSARLGVIPYTTYRLDVLNHIPVMEPTLGGVFLVHPTGDVEKLTRAQALADPRLKGHPLYSVDFVPHLEWGYERAYNYVHPDLVPVVAPSLIHGDDRVYWFGAYARKTQTDQVETVLLDARSGALTLHQNVPFTANAHQAFTIAHSDVPGARSSDVVPVFQNGVLYWEVRPPQTAARRFPKVLVNSETSAATFIPDETSFTVFLRNGALPVTDARAPQSVDALSLADLSNADLLTLQDRINRTLRARLAPSPTPASVGR